MQSASLDGITLVYTLKKNFFEDFKQIYFQN